MEETRKKEGVVKDVEKEEVGETSRAGGRGQPKEEEDSVKIVIIVGMPAEKVTQTLEDVFRSLREACDDKDSSTAGNTNPENNPVIPLVPKALREKAELKKYYEPTKISIGPYHHGKENLRAGESIKLGWAEQFLKIRKVRDDWPLELVRREIKELRACYDSNHVKEDKYDDETLTRILFVDGCSVLHYMCCCLDRNMIALNLNNSDLDTWQKDLILLENQIPYRVLDLLQKQTSFAAGYPVMEVAVFNDFVRWFIYESPERDSGKEITFKRDLKKPSHLLEILQRQYTSGYIVTRALKNRPSPSEEESGRRRSFFFHNITELTAKGISLKPLSNYRYGFIDIVFKRNTFFNPQLLLRPITVYRETKTKLLNVIALEMSSSSENRYVTSYICFLNSLISNQDDVKELMEADILYNCLGSNEELAQFFKEIAYNLASDYGIYNDVRSKIDKYLHIRSNNIIWSWKTEAARTYLQSPWKFIGVVAGFVALVVTMVQTYFTIFPLHNKSN